jgi:acetylornithine deacetylase/succinyl-diaminopimelate desuccinylase-like protein
MEKRQLARAMNEQARKWYPRLEDLTNDEILNETINVQQIPAPTFEEVRRADYLYQRFQALPFNATERDEMGNIYGWYGATGHNNIVLVAAHHDTVFPLDTDLSIRTEGNHIYGPGIGDNSLGVAGLLMLGTHILPELKLQKVALCIVANVREEGLGNLEGIRAVIDHLGASRIKAAIVLEGMALGRVYHGGIAVRRLKICTAADGGHSWMSFGKASAIHGLVQIAAEITKLSVPTEPRTTFNIGIIEGGRSVNSIATDAHFMLDMRSSEPAALQHLDNEVRNIIERYQRDDLDCRLKVIGERPAGHISASHLLVKMALRALHEIGLAGILEHGSTDANMLLSQNIPTVVVGLSYGGNAHRLDEFIEKTHMKQGFYQLVVLLTTLLAHLERGGQLSYEK